MSNKVVIIGFGFFAGLLAGSCLTGLVIFTLYKVGWFGDIGTVISFAGLFMLGLIQWLYLIPIASYLKKSENEFVRALIPGIYASGIFGIWVTLSGNRPFV